MLSFVLVLTLAAEKVCSDAPCFKEAFKTCQPVTFVARQVIAPPEVKGRLSATLVTTHTLVAEAGACRYQKTARLEAPPATAVPAADATAAQRLAQHIARFNADGRTTRTCVLEPGALPPGLMEAETDDDRWASCTVGRATLPTVSSSCEWRSFGAELVCAVGTKTAACKGPVRAPIGADCTADCPRSGKVELKCRP